MKLGKWCLHCETAWHGESVIDDECPNPKCDGGFMDLFPISGAFKDGERVEQYSGRFEELRDGAA